MDFVVNKTFVWLSETFILMFKHILSGDKLQTVKVISDPEAFQQLADETRRKMIYLLRVKDMTVSQIAEQLGLTTQAIYHHIRKLKDVGMIEIAREERVGHFIETYYRATAEVFHITHGESGTQKDYEMGIKAALEGLRKLGMEVDCSPAKVKELVRVQKKMKEGCAMKEWEDKVSNLGLDFLTQQAVIEYASQISMAEKEFDELQANEKTVWQLLRACVEAPQVKKNEKKKYVKKK